MSTLCIATTTFYKSGPMDKIRTDLAIETVTEAIRKGFNIAIVDGKSCAEFLQSLTKIQKDSNGLVTIETQKGETMSDSRRQAIKLASGRIRANGVICWVEPEKVSIVRDCLPGTADPIMEGAADIVIPKRTDESYLTYPRYQAESERRANAEYNALLREHKLIKDDIEYDFWFGPRLFANRPELLKLFTHSFPRSGEAELWANATFLPVVLGFQKGLRILSAEVPYKHPRKQTEYEEGNAEMDRKRDLQRETIIAVTKQYLSDRET